MMRLSPIRRWLRAPLRVRWYRPPVQRHTAEALPGDVYAVRFVESHRSELDLHNAGRGSAVDLEITTAPATGEGDPGEMLARLPVLGLDVRYARD